MLPVEELRECEDMVVLKVIWRRGLFSGEAEDMMEELKLREGAMAAVASEERLEARGNRTGCQVEGGR